MSRHYSCNQYNGAFEPKILLNYEVPKFYVDKPLSPRGPTKFIANEKGYIIPGYPRAKEMRAMCFEAWDFPKKITRETANQLNGLAYLKDLKLRALKPRPTHRPSPKLQRKKSEESDVTPEVEVEEEELEKKEIVFCPIHFIKVNQEKEKQDDEAVQKAENEDEKRCKCIKKPDNN